MWISWSDLTTTATIASFKSSICAANLSDVTCDSVGKFPATSCVNSVLSNNGRLSKSVTRTGFSGGFTNTIFEDAYRTSGYILLNVPWHAWPSWLVWSVLPVWPSWHVWCGWPSWHSWHYWLLGLLGILGLFRMFGLFGSLGLLGILGLPLALLDLAEGGVAGGGADLGLLGALLLDHLLRRAKGGRSASTSRGAPGVYPCFSSSLGRVCAPAGLETRFDETRL